MANDEIKSPSLRAAIGDLYEEIKIARLTGWTLEYIESLGLLRREGLLQIVEAEESVIKAKRK